MNSIELALETIKHDAQYFKRNKELILKTKYVPFKKLALVYKIDKDIFNYYAKNKQIISLDLPDVIFKYVPMECFKKIYLRTDQYALLYKYGHTRYDIKILEHFPNYIINSTKFYGHLFKYSKVDYKYISKKMLENPNFYIAVYPYDTEIVRIMPEKFVNHPQLQKILLSRQLKSIIQLDGDIIIEENCLAFWKNLENVFQYRLRNSCINTSPVLQYIIRKKFMFVTEHLENRIRYYAKEPPIEDFFGDQSIYRTSEIYYFSVCVKEYITILEMLICRKETPYDLPNKLSNLYFNYY